MSYDNWKCTPPEEEFETEACGHIVGTCVCEEAPVEDESCDHDGVPADKCAHCGHVSGLTLANAPTLETEVAERRRVVELERRDWVVRVLREAAHLRVLTGDPNDWFTNTDEELMHLAKVMFAEELPAATRAELGTRALQTRRG